MQKQTGVEGQKLKNESETFRMGNLDSLMFMNDQLIKMESSAESLLKKIERLYVELDDGVEVGSDLFKVDKQDISSYLLRFRWSEKTYPRNKQVADLISDLAGRVGTNDHSIKACSSQLADIKARQQALTRRGGNPMTADLDDVLNEKLVQEGDFPQSNMVRTVVVVVHNKSEQELVSKYTLLGEGVVPGSLRKFNYKDKDGYVIYRFMVMTLVKPQVPAGNKAMTAMEQVVANCKELKVTVRDFKYDPEESQRKTKAALELKAESSQSYVEMKNKCLLGYDDLYQAYVHLKVLRFTIDQSMRFGQSEPTLIAMLKPKNGMEKKVQSKLTDMFLEDQSQREMYGTKEELEDIEDFFPFIYVPINIH